MVIYTIGFTKTSAESFFGRVKDAEVKSVVDVRLKADSQLSGFAKKKDLRFFLDELLGIEYQHSMHLAPSQEILDAYKKGRMAWGDYSVAYLDLIRNRHVESLINPDDIDGACFLCSEDLPHKCHRRLAAEYLAANWSANVEIVHL